MAGVQDTSNPDLTYHSLVDFTPGITTRNELSGSTRSELPIPSNLGAAQVNTTWGCVGLPGGGLAPGPRTVPMPTLAAVADSGDEVFSPQVICIGGILATGPIFPNADSSTPNSANYAPYIFEGIAYSAFTLWTDSGAGTTIVKEVYYFIRNWGTALGTTTTLTSVVADDAAAALIPGSFFGHTSTIRTADSDNTAYGYPTIMRMGGYAFIGLGNDSRISGIQGVIYPDVDTSDGSSGFASYTSPTGVNGYHVVAHQGRLVWVQSWLRAFGTTGNVPIHSQLGYTEVNDIFTSGGTLNLPDLGLDGVRSMYSVSASELLIITGRGGAISIRGDLNNPTIVRYPSVQGTEGIANVGCNTPLGYVYGSRSGVYAWKGGDDSILLSPQMDGSFWISTLANDHMERRMVNAGSFAYSAPFIFAPNNYMFDIRTQAWWRYAPIGGMTEESLGAPETPTSAFGFHSAGPFSGDVYAAVYSALWNPASTYRPLVRIIRDEQQQHFIWTSQPLTFTRRRLAQIRELILLAQGSGTVTVTFSSAIEPIPATTATFTISSTDKPVRIPVNYSYDGSDLVCTIESYSGSDGVPAPTVWSLDMGVKLGVSV